MQRPITSVMLFWTLLFFNKCFFHSFVYLNYLFCSTIIIPLNPLEVNKSQVLLGSTSNFLGSIRKRLPPLNRLCLLGLPPPLLSAFTHSPLFTNHQPTISENTKVYCIKTSSLTYQITNLAAAHVNCVVYFSCALIY